MKSKMILPFLVLSGVPFIMVLGNSMHSRFPQMKEAMGLTQFQVGLMVTLFPSPPACSFLLPECSPITWDASGHGSGPHHLRARRTVGRAGGRNIVKTHAMILVARVVQGIRAAGLTNWLWP